MKIYNDDGIAKKFSKEVFDVIIKEKPRDGKIKELEEQFNQTYDLREKARIKKEIAETKQILKGNKKFAKEDN